MATFQERVEQRSARWRNVLRKPSNLNLSPLEVKKGDGSSFDLGSVQERDANAATASVDESRRPRRLNSRTDRLLATRMNELSQLESPLLRELALWLSEKLQIEMPLCPFEKFEHPYTSIHVGDRWEEIQGCNDWKGLLEPDFDPVLKGEILRYGEFAQATYDAFDRDRNSIHYGICKYTKDNLLEQVGLENRGYGITNFLYATTNLRRYPNFLAHTSEGGSKTVNEKSGTVSSENSRQSNWIGFVAVSTSPEEIARLGRRDIVIAWRGSVTMFDWIADFMDVRSPVAFGPDVVPSNVRVEAGFYHLYTSTNVLSRYNQRKSARDQVRDAVKHLVGKYRHEGKLSITVTGHSLGSALATLCAYDIAVCQDNLLTGISNVPDEWHFAESRHEVAHHGDQGDHSLSLQSSQTFGGQISENLERIISSGDGVVNKFPRGRIPVTVYSFGGPRVGNKHFADSMKAQGVAVLRVVNVHDMVRKVPGIGIHGSTLGNLFSSGMAYKHVGVKLKVDNEKSKYLQKPAGRRRPHNLEGYLHLVDSYHGPGKPYAKTSRDIALVNKSADYLVRKHGIPPCWWQEKNKGLVRDKSGEWRYSDRDTSVPVTPPPNQEEEEWNHIVEAAEMNTQKAMSHETSEPHTTSNYGRHI